MEARGSSAADSTPFLGLSISTAESGRVRRLRSCEPIGMDSRDDNLVLSSVDGWIVLTWSFHGVYGLSYSIGMGQWGGSKSSRGFWFANIHHRWLVFIRGEV